VTAAFYNFHPDMVALAVPGCWERVPPDAVVLLRVAAATEALTSLCSGPSLGTLIGALPLLRIASDHCGASGRILAGANRALWPRVEPELRGRGLGGPELGLAEAWQACTTLREHRGDGHVAALLTHELSGLEAHLLVAGCRDVPAEVLRYNRGWTPEEWEWGSRRLLGRGLLGADGVATDAGRTALHSVEALTDQLAEPAFEVLSDGEANSLYGALVDCAGQIQASGLFPFPNPMGLPAL